MIVKWLIGMMTRNKLRTDFPQFDFNYIECGNGWLGLLYNMATELSRLNCSVEFLQIKEKFGGLRVYIHVEGKDADLAYELEDKYEKLSYKYCEMCGTTDNVTVEGSWIKTLCKSCRSK